MYMVTTKKLKYTDNSILIYMRKSKISLAKKILTVLQVPMLQSHLQSIIKYIIEQMKNSYYLLDNNNELSSIFLLTNCYP
jgi:hypothetical protein